ncbi:MarR family winged helix-turn-helix transcriptional regulator [uncultured Methanobrevibacter sp.]|uniref:MarR family winged helix-turn-helix transcriptional regulator n=1 Tax=uncultured Methanobrevibacter sp. TaxID=253161 RepID=UPI00258EFF05|nr:MarR family transcriptional regulator [uncultured Methanobrevibacter sp.]
MTLPKQFKEDNFESIRIYHYVEELVYSYREYMGDLLRDNEVSLAEAPFLIRLRFSDNTTQMELTKLFKVSKGYTAKLLRRFEDNGWVKREEDPKNRRKKIVNLTPEGVKKTDELIGLLDTWENKVSSGLSDVEISVLKNLLFKLVLETENF